MDIADHVFLVTGAASGLGAAVADLLFDRGARVVCADIGPRAGDTAGGERAVWVRCDVTREDDGAAAVEAATRHFGALHGLVHCAGIVHGQRLIGRDGPHALDAFARVITVNLVGTFNMIRLAAPAMAAGAAGADGERGVIVTTASVAAFEGQIGQAAYSASKAGVAGMTLPLARDLARHGIRVVSVAPGIFDTAMLASLPEDAKSALGSAVPFPPRAGRPAEFARLVAEIIGNPMLNGTTIRLDGALRLAPR